MQRTQPLNFPLIKSNWQLIILFPIHEINFPIEIKIIIGNKNITTKIYGIQANHSIICGYFSITFVNFMLKGKSLLDYTNLFSPNKYDKNDKIILKYFQ